MNKDAPAIQFKNLTKIYRSGFWGKKHQALSSLSLDVPTGSIFGFLGANGAGKTTTIKILMSLQYATEGTVSVWGGEVENRITQDRIGFMPERPTFHLDLTGNEFLNFHRSLYGKRNPDRNYKTNIDLLKMVGISEVGGTLLREFSKGMLQRIGLAQTLVNSPDLIVLDEPMSGLDPVGRRDIRNLIFDLSQEGKTIFLSSHILADVEAICDRVAFLEKGVLKACGTIDEVVRERSKLRKELVFGKIADDVIESASVLSEAKRFGNHWKIFPESDEDVQKIVECVWEKKGRIVSLAHEHDSLEKALFPALNKEVED